MKGKLYGIGVGPGDKELLTIKAINTMEKCDIIAFPITKEKNQVAFLIVESYIKDKEVCSIYFSMEKDSKKRIEARENAANKICEFLENGKDVGFVTLGDPSIYSTYMYVHKIIAEKGFKTEIIPGVTSFCAVAAALNTSLCEGDESLNILAANENNIDEILDIKGNKVIMKSGKNITKIISKIKEKGLCKNAKIVECSNMKDEKIYENIEDFNGNSYFSTIVIKEEF